MATAPFHNIAICGGGLAGHMCAAALTHILPDDINITYVQTSNAGKTDAFFGTVTSPTIYKFLLSIGISEPEILLKTNTAFSLGTRYVNWGKRSWIQAFHQPLPIFGGVELHHHVMRHHNEASESQGIEPYIMSVQAAHKGVFAHPPSERKTPLADVEYGYHFLPSEWSKLLFAHLSRNQVKIISSDVASVQHEAGNITSLSLTDGQEVTADLFIDCTGDSAQILSKLEPNRKGKRRLQAISQLELNRKTQGVCRALTGTDQGWTAETPLRNSQHRLTIISTETKDKSLPVQDRPGSEAVDVNISHTLAPWTGNCVAIGHAAAILEPLTPAPMILLERDITRLLELIPVSENMTVESQEYNRRFSNDIRHADFFQRTFFEIKNLPGTDYWRAVTFEPICEKLSAKIEQFNSRGSLVQYDYEPFNPQDWTMLHFGLGHIPARYDILADVMPKHKIENTLGQMRMAIAKVAEKMPPHDIYMSNLLKYLKEKHG